MGTDPAAPGAPALDPLAEIDHIIDEWTDERHDHVEEEEQAEAERTQFLDDFSKLMESTIRPAMHDALDRLAKDGGAGLIEERENDLEHRPRAILWMSLQGPVGDPPRQDRNPYLQLDADVGRKRIDVWEGDMWEKQGVSRATSPWALSEVTQESVSRRIVEIVRRAAQHTV